ncbi:MAG: PAS domain S-box protein [Paludibacteraceae bacterium]|nr:PAS domain S-box protein [Paludibacteraceae bacterium]
MSILAQPEQDFQKLIDTQKRIIDTLFAGTNDAFIITDTRRKIKHFNKSAEEITGYSIVDAINRDLSEIIKLADENGDISVEIFCPTGEFSIQGTVFQGENLKFTAKDGIDKIVNFKTVKVKEGSEVDLGSIVFIENTFAQADLERTKLDFVSMAEHVLRTPITIIRGYISRLLEEKTTSKLDETEIGYLNNAFMGTTELLTLAEDLMSITEIRKTAVKLHLTDLNIEGLVSKVVDEFKIVAAQKGMKISFIPPLYKIAMVKADISKIKVVLQNLIDNSIKYSSEGTVMISIKNLDDRIQVEVHDQGKGIPQENIPQLFTKFYRVKKALEMEHGMGLGLYISKKIIDAHSGDIWAKSNEQEGTSFYFTLPIAEEDDSNL